MGCKVILFSSCDRKKISSINSVLLDGSIKRFLFTKYKEINARNGINNNKIFLFFNLFFKIKKKLKTVTGNHATTKWIIIIKRK